MYKDLAAIKAAAAASEHDHKFFDPDTMKFWRSRVSSKVWPVVDGAYFITSETDGERPRRYTVRFIDATGSIDTIGPIDTIGNGKPLPGFRAHATMREAKMHARGAADGHHIPVADA